MIVVEAPLEGTTVIKHPADLTVRHISISKDIVGWPSLRIEFTNGSSLYCIETRQTGEIEINLLNWIDGSIVEKPEEKIMDCIIPTGTPGFSDGDIFTVGKFKQKYRAILRDLIIREPGIKQVT